jgi:hypothetical protein
VFAAPINRALWAEVVIASEAKQSSGQEEDLDCFVATLLAMTIARARLN